MDLKQYIYPIYSGGTIVGQGFIADGYFITAAHVVKDFPSCFTRINSKRFELSDTFIRSSFFNKSDAYDKIIKEDFYHNPLSKLEYIFIGIGNIYQDPTMMDIVLYPCNDIESPLRLSQHIPPKGEQLTSYCMHEEMDFSQLNPPCKLKTVPALALGQEEGNYFYCNCEQFAGSSGSPLLNGNEVVGIMHGGNDKGLCAFLKVQMVRNFISQMELSLDFDSSDLDNAIDYEECKYSRDKKRLLKGSGDIIQQGTVVICNEAFCREDFKGDLYGIASGNIIIPNSVKKIGEKAFAWSKELESIMIPDSVVHIGKEAFECCTYLKRVILSNSITEITEALFSWCQSLKEIIIPNSVTKIGAEAFENCDSLTNLIIPSSVKCIEYLAFSECTSLTQVIFLGTVENIDEDIFERCSSLSQILIPSGTIDQYEEMLPDYTDILVEDEFIGKVANPLEWSPIGDAFTLKEICDETGMFNYDDILGDEAELIGIEFGDSSSTLRIAIPFKDGSKTELKAGVGIQKHYDEGDKVKVNLIYGQELQKIGHEIIVRYDVWKSEEEKKKYLEERNGENLSTEVIEVENLSTEVTEEDLANAWTDEYGVKYSADRKRLLKAANNLEDYSIKSGTIVICDNAFSQCKDLQIVIIPDSVTAIGDFAFYDCGRLSCAELPTSVKNMGMCVFEGCERMPNYHPFE